MMIKTKPATNNNALKEQLQQAFSNCDHIACAYLFGSVAKGIAGALSDIDIAVFLENHSDIESERTKIETSICNALERSDIDLIILNEAPFTLAYRILRDGMVLIAPNLQAKENFEVRTIMNYLDFQPLLSGAFETSRQEILKVK